MKVSHEVPSVLLGASRAFNDYDYALVHLFEKSEPYFDFYVESLAMGREVILDNSLYELGEAFDAEEFAVWIRKLKPTIYIVPDSFNNGPQTIENFRKWEKDQGDITQGLKMGVVQGQTYQELADCYRFMDSHADIVGISFGYKYYEMTGVGHNKEQRMANARPKFISNLIADGIWNPDKPVHLLGCALPQEFLKYTVGYKNIRSLDTSSPVLHGMFNIKLTERGLDTKHPVKLAEVFGDNVTTEQYNTILHNVSVFRQMVRG